MTIDRRGHHDRHRTWPTPGGAHLPIPVPTSSVAHRFLRFGVIGIVALTMGCGLAAVVVAWRPSGPASGMTRTEALHPPGSATWAQLALGPYEEAPPTTESDGPAVAPPSTEAVTALVGPRTTPVASPPTTPSPTRVTVRPTAARSPGSSCVPRRGPVAGAEATLDIPSLDLHLPIVAGDQATIDDDLVTHYEDPSFPAPVAPGQPGAYWLAGHSICDVFGSLPNIAEGADIYVTTDGGTVHHYQVVSRALFPGDAAVAWPSLYRYGNASYAMLQTCVGPWRLEVYALAVPAAGPSQASAVASHVQTPARTAREAGRSQLRFPGDGRW